MGLPDRGSGPGREGQETQGLRGGLEGRRGARGPQERGEHMGLSSGIPRDLMDQFRAVFWGLEPALAYARQVFLLLPCRERCDWSLIEFCRIRSVASRTGQRPIARQSGGCIRDVVFAIDEIRS